MSPYSPQTWHNAPAIDTPVNATRLMAMENGIATAQATAESAQAAGSTTVMTSVPGIPTDAAVVAAGGDAVDGALALNAVANTLYTRLGGVWQLTRALQFEALQIGLETAARPVAPFTLTASSAYIVRFIAQRNMTIDNVGFTVTTAASVDDDAAVGIYNSIGARLRTSGWVKGGLNSTGTHAISFPAIDLVAGTIYYAAFSVGTFGGTAAALMGENRGSGLAWSRWGTTLPLMDGSHSTTVPMAVTWSPTLPTEATMPSLLAGAVATPPDITPPDTTIDSGPSGSTTSTSATFTFTSNEAGSTFEVQLDGGGWSSAGGTSKSYSGLSTGSHTFEVRATDPTGNVDAVPASRTWTVVASATGRNLNIPMGLGNTNDSNLSSGNYIYGIRFVLNEATTMYRFMSQFKAKGAGPIGSPSWDPHGAPYCSTSGSGCYGAGNGGSIRAKLVTTNVDGTPNMSNVLATETFSPPTRYAETIAYLGIGTLALFYFINCSNVVLSPDTMYVMTYQNIAADPLHNFVSCNSVCVHRSVAGPHDTNTTDKNAAGAIAGLDPRETCCWSQDGGSTWTFGWQVGHYFGNNTDVNGTRLPHYGYVTSGGTRIGLQPYSAYNVTATGATTRLVNASKAVTITQGGGYGGASSVGVVTVRNVTTGVQGTTASLGTGLPVGNLNVSVPVAVGDTVDFTASGTVYKSMADAYVVSTFNVGNANSEWPLTQGGTPSPAQVFGLPWPAYRHGD